MPLGCLSGPPSLLPPLAPTLVRVTDVMEDAWAAALGDVMTDRDATLQELREGLVPVIEAKPWVNSGPPDPTEVIAALASCSVHLNFERLCHLSGVEKT